MPVKECLILAAGMSTRMGTWKMMLPWREGTVLDGAIADALSFCDRVILVTGFRGAELHQRYAQHPDIELVYNANYQEGMFSSIRAGVKHIKARHFFIALGDMPATGAGVYATLWRQRKETCLIPEYQQGRGHPVLLPFSIIEKIVAAGADDSLKTVVRQFGSQAVGVAENGIHWDVDTPQQYQQLLARCRASGEPPERVTEAVLHHQMR